MKWVGAIDLIGTTNLERNNYFQNDPRNALDQVLWMEPDLMGHLLGAVNQAKLDEQLGAVRPESLVWIVAGVHNQVEALGIADIEIIYTYGNSTD
ncbi:MAG: hypothetical protein VYE30_04580 [Pseudomonadota bacterium]|nr:hypothetical protein [Pseudomonadota bacterium]